MATVANIQRPVNKSPKKYLLRELPQIGRSDKEADAVRKALLPGKRVSKTGKIYWETRKDRSDAKGKMV